MSVPLPTVTTIDALRALGWCWINVNTYVNDKYPGTFTYREACEKERP